MLDGEALEAALSNVLTTAVEGLAYRVIPAQHHLTALSTIGALRRGGRYNPRGQLEALYLAEDPMLALQEVEAVQQTSGELVGGQFSPKTLLTVEYRLQRHLDLTVKQVQQLLKMTVRELIKPWVLEQTSTRFAPTQHLGLAIAQAGIEAIRAPSAKSPDRSNLVIYPRNLVPGSSIRVYDDSGFIDATLP